jgi:hypothetical protein
MVTEEQWAAAADDLNMTIDGLRARIAAIDTIKLEDMVQPDFKLPPLHFDWDLEPITLGQWAMLYEAPSYHFVARSVLPNRYWVATIWTGVNEEIGEPPVVFESAVFLLDPEIERLPPSTINVTHADLAAARRGHTDLVARAATLHHQR